MFKKTVAIVIAVLFILAAGYIGLKFFYVDAPVLKAAISNKDFSGREYIICERATVTGFDWVVVERNGEKTFEYCKISGDDPYTYFDFNTTFRFDNNRFVFYVDKRQKDSSEGRADACYIYTVSGWDILYPIKREYSPFDVLKSSRYIT